MNSTVQTEITLISTASRSIVKNPSFETVEDAILGFRRIRKEHAGLITAATLRYSIDNGATWHAAK